MEVVNIRIAAHQIPAGARTFRISEIGHDGAVRPLAIDFATEEEALSVARALIQLTAAEHAARMLIPANER